MADIDLNATLLACDGRAFTLDGVSGRLRASEGRYGSVQLRHVADAKGRRSEPYRAMRARLGDDYETCFEEIPAAVMAVIEKRGLYRYK